MKFVTPLGVRPVEVDRDVPSWAPDKTVTYLAGEWREVSDRVASQLAHTGLFHVRPANDPNGIHRGDIVIALSLEQEDQRAVYIGREPTDPDLCGIYSLVYTFDSFGRPVPRDACSVRLQRVPLTSIVFWAHAPDYTHGGAVVKRVRYADLDPKY